MKPMMMSTITHQGTPLNSDSSSGGDSVVKLAVASPLAGDVWNTYMYIVQPECNVHRVPDKKGPLYFLS